MILQCPACDTRYILENLVIPDQGRVVRCAKCQHSWHQMPEPGAVSASGGVVGVIEPITSPREEKPQERQRPGGSARHNIRTLQSLPRHLPRKWWIPAAAAGFALLVFAVGLFVFRKDVVAAWEPSARLFDVAGAPVPVPGEGLQIAGLDVKPWKAEGRNVLLVSGTITNPTATPREVPPLLLSVRDNGKRELFSWLHTLPGPTLAAGESRTFHTQQFVDNELATNLVARFSTAHPVTTVAAASPVGK